MERVLELIEAMNLRQQDKIALHDALGILAVAAHRLSLSDKDEKDLMVFVVEFIIDARRHV